VFDRRRDRRVVGGRSDDDQPAELHIRERRRLYEDAGVRRRPAGQKDLSAHAVATPSPTDLWVAWKWDETSISGGNTGDACSLFDTGAPNAGRVNFAVCVTIAGTPAAQVANTSPRIYTCGDGKVDRCTSQYALVPKPYGTACSVNQAGVDRTARGIRVSWTRQLFATST
jgi:hypothetical protein